MQCKQARALLSAYLDEQLEPVVHRELVEHLASCPICRREEQELATAVRLLRHFGSTSCLLEDDGKPITFKESGTRSNGQ